MAESKPTTSNTTANPTIPQGPRVPDEGKDTERTPAQPVTTPVQPAKRGADDGDRDEEDGDDAKRAKRVASKEKHQPW